MSVFRVIGIAAAALSGGAALARNQLDKTIEKKIDAKIEEAQQIALGDLEAQIKTIVGEQLLGFVQNLAFKACFIAILVALYFLGIFDRTALGYVITAALGLFLIRDIWALYPTAAQLWNLSRRHKWNLFQALREMVAANVFDQAYEQVMDQTKDAKVKYWIALSRYSQEDISQHIADAISKIAATASVPIVRTHAGLALGKAATMLAVYSLTLTWVIIYL
ncbi:hypothetical protein [Hirschia baltica]|uniref:Uncharacterized protein n=1 Tax=Hirschia baltica (strain ATCC 49814 / DSM 5838 / IFAM 1418) TaxID=582402 RepID=C6XLS1_HIRBI|nr:hypothetical protein [Hirschia baltica]ACT57977.1 hypothetical protein Hbal_0275 [Hirschia baltica ATCC 49814]